MSRLLKIGSMLLLALGLVAIAAAEEPRPENEWNQGFHPAGLTGVSGTIFEEVRGPIDNSEELVPFLKHRSVCDETTIEGKSITAVKYVYRNQPAKFLEFPTTTSLDPTFYMAAQFKPRSCSAFIRVDFNVQVSVVPGAGSFAACAYAIYVKEDGGDGRISNPGEIECGGDDTCGYLKQFGDFALWLGAITDVQQYTAAATSNFFRARCHRKYEIQAHVYPVHHPGNEQGTVYLNAGFIGLTSGK